MIIIFLNYKFYIMANLKLKYLKTISLDFVKIKRLKYNLTANIYLVTLNK